MSVETTAAGSLQEEQTTRKDIDSEKITARSALEKTKIEDAFGSSSEEETTKACTPPPAAAKHDWRFWVIFLSMCIAVFGSSLDATIITTSLPAITQDIGGEQQYVWIGNSWAIAATAIQPFAGQLSNIFGRRFTMISTVLLFILGSGLCGGASSVAVLIAGRTIQGLGSGGIVMITDLIVCDLIPMRERGNYLGLIGATATISTMLGPIIGGALAIANWRWIFYIQLPIGSVAAIVMFFFLRLNYQADSTWAKALSRIDYLGSTLFMASIVSILLGLVMGGTVFPWSSFRVIVPIVLGFVGWGVFHVHQASGLAKEPTVPPRLFTNRTSFAAFVLSFISAMLLEWIVYFMPVYFQGVDATTPIISGVDILPFNAFFFPFAIVAGGLLTKTGRYRPIHAIGFASVALGCGLFSILNGRSNKAEWVFFQIFSAIGMGVSVTTILPAIQASLPESDVAAATGMYGFLRSFGLVWGITIPSIIFNGRINQMLGTIDDTSVQSQMANGNAYGFGSQVSTLNLDSSTQDSIVSVYTDALQKVWYGAMAFALLGFLIVFVQKHVELRTELDTEFGMKEKTVKDEEKAVKPDENLD